MKKAPSLKLRNPPKSQPSIASFFNKNPQQNATTKDKGTSSSVLTLDEKKYSPNDCGNNGNTMEKNKRKISTEIEDNSNKNVCNILIKENSNENDRKTKLSTILLKGKYHDNTDQRVPDVYVSPSKKCKLSLTRKTSKSNLECGSIDKKLTTINSEEKQKNLETDVINSEIKENRTENGPKSTINVDDYDHFKSDINDDVMLLNSLEILEKESLVTIDKCSPKIIDKENNGVSPVINSCANGNNKLSSPLKPFNINVSPQKNKKVQENNKYDEVKKLDDFEFTDDFDISEDFLEDWSPKKLDGEKKKMLDLTTWQRCTVAEYETSECHTKKILQVRGASGETQATCWVQGFWMDCRITKGDTISLLGVQCPSNANVFLVNDLYGLIVTQPDLLVSGTAIMGSLFCKRKAVLQDKFRGVDSPNKAMVIGSLVHQLFQISLSKQLTNEADLQAECHTIMKSLNVVYALHDAGADSAEITQEVMKYGPQILTFINKYVKGIKSSGKPENKQEWKGKIDSILDIEENIWSPVIGVKGKIDVTIEVTIHDRKAGKEKRLMPLELKTGRPTVSAEHRGQVILYNMMLEQISQAVKPHTSGLLLYLKDTIGIHEVSAGQVEKRDLMMLRNDLAYYLSRWLEYGNVSETSDQLEKCNIVELPEPVNHHSACGKCPYLTVCSVYLHTSGYSLSSEHPLKKLEATALGHLTPAHMAYFLKWTYLICLEDREASISKPLKDIWMLTPQEREKKGRCIFDARVVGRVEQEGDRYYHQFNIMKKDGVDSIQKSGLQVGDYAVVSTKQRFALAAGTIVQVQHNSYTMLLERDLTKRNSADTTYNIDTYESQTLVVYNLTNLGLLMDNDDMANHLKSIIIDKKPASFDQKIPRGIVEKSKDVLGKLNPVQQRAVLKALTTHDYLLIRGMPGTGKTQTIVALIEILYGLGREVLVTSHTHSAVDNIFIRLKGSGMKLLRLGSSKRIHKDLLDCSEGHLMQGNPQDLIELYSKAQIVGVTCLGSNHSLLAKRSFDLCIVDESTQVMQPSILRPLFAAKKFVLVGDPDQLPPIIRSSKARTQGLDESLFVRLNSEESTISLNLQYRMNAPIMALANHLTYRGALKAADQIIENTTLFTDCKNRVEINQPLEPWLRHCLSDTLRDSVVFLDTEDTSQHSLNTANKSVHSLKNKNYSNVYEASVVNKILTKVIECGIEGDEVGVIAPYREQVFCIRHLCQPSGEDHMNGAAGDQMRRVEINTVDQFQGRDKKVVIFSCTKSRSEEENVALKTTENEILEDQRRLTVAITRAKYKLIIIGDRNTLKKYTPFSRLIQGMEQHGTTVKLCHEDIL